MSNNYPTPPTGRKPLIVTDIPSLEESMKTEQANRNGTFIDGFFASNPVASEDGSYPYATFKEWYDKTQKAESN